MRMALWCGGVSVLVTATIVTLGPMGVFVAALSLMTLVVITAERQMRRDEVRVLAREIRALVRDLPPGPQRQMIRAAVRDAQSTDDPDARRAALRYACQLARTAAR